MAREETAIHVHARWGIPVSQSVEVALFGGPTFFSVSQAFVTGIDFDQAYPYDTATLTTAMTRTQDGSTIGFNVGADVSVYFSRWVGVGGLIDLRPLRHADHLRVLLARVMQHDSVAPLPARARKPVFRVTQGSLFTLPRGPFSSCRYQCAPRSAGPRPSRPAPVCRAPRKGHSCAPEPWRGPQASTAVASGPVEREPAPPGRRGPCADRRCCSHRGPGCRPGRPHSHGRDAAPRCTGVRRFQPRCRCPDDARMAATLGRGRVKVLASGNPTRYFAAAFTFAF